MDFTSLLCRLIELCKIAFLLGENSGVTKAGVGDVIASNFRILAVTYGPLTRCCPRRKGGLCGAALAANIACPRHSTGTLLGLLRAPLATLDEEDVPEDQTYKKGNRSIK
jgi:hypothetical protein